MSGHYAVIESIEFIALSLEIMGVAVIALSFMYAIVRAVLHLRQRREHAYDVLKIFIGKALMLGLEFLVAADIIRTVSTEPTMNGLGMLGLLIVLRTFLGWSIAVETEGHWPWQEAQYKKG